MSKSILQNTKPGIVFKTAAFDNDYKGSPNTNQSNRGSS